ncbi:hypothetical protein PENSTE_c002G03703 [Penicillium steckii]|uniref:FAD-binding domain-containing protein n=1 Tax=Penicillium steckii TaxID=303698 RepID=A0A1V6TTH0_9EURO|nr:hypothetical protein PENSTE_c002G03703 [Penicillium steckii]
MNRLSYPGLRVVIVGAGFAGLTAAIECKIRGLNPVLVETYPGPSSHGDLLDFVRNAGRVFESWGNGKVGRRLASVSPNAAKYLDFLNSKNELLRREDWPQATDIQYVFAGHRGEMHEIVYDYAKEIGVDLQFGKRVVHYLDTEDERGVIVDGGEKILGDVVIAADGPKSLARCELLGLEESKVNSGYAIFRAYFNITPEMLEKPFFSELVRRDEDIVRCWVGPDIHGFIYVWKNGRDCAWVLTHLDDSDIAESWSESASKEDVIYYLEKAGFPEVWRETVDATPESRLIDYKLVWRDPLRTWLSPSKKCAVIGDAAHCHLPTSAQGACQAVEDAVTISMCLQKCEGDVALGLQVFERIRFNRSHTIHQASISTRDIYHKNDWTPEMVKRNPNSLVLPFYDWVTEYNVFEEVENNYGRLAADIKAGRQGSIEELSLPAGGNYDAMNIAGDEGNKLRESRLA